MKKHNFSKTLAVLAKSFMALTLAAGLNACDGVIYNYEEDCDPPTVVPDPKPDPKPDPTPTPQEPGPIHIYVRTNPGSAGTSKVHEVAKADNEASTTEGIYVGIEIDIDGTYTLTATETNPDYRFVRWHDDTNDGNLTDGKKVIENITALAETRYTAVFEPINPDEPAPGPEPTVYYVDFVFDMNMQFTDGFSEKVRSVDLYVFNTGGAFVQKYHAEGAALSVPGYRMELTDLPAGTYEMIAWCDGDPSFSYFTVPASISRNYDATSTMKVKTKDGVTYQDENLGAMFHGRKTEATYTDEPGEQVHTVYLTKDTNNINLSLQHRQGIPFEKDRFVITMVDNNGYLLYDNSLPSTNGNIEYRPYRTVLYNTDEARVNTTEGNFLQVELSTCRLMTDHDPVIEVVDTENDNKVIFSIPLVKWALNLRSTNYKDIPPQDYLDREDNYNLMLWMDSNDDGWFGAEIKIIDWHVVDDSTTIK